MKDIQREVEEILKLAVEEGRELGIQAAAYCRGEWIVDAWAGTADRSTGKPVKADTLFPVFSVTKGVSATVLHILAEQGKLDYDMRVAELWPEFGCSGKDSITIRHVLNHTAGLPHFPPEAGLREAADWETMCGKLARLAPLSPPGQRVEYHAVTFGWLVGEIARRADGRPFPRLLEEEICRPLGIRDLYVGLPGELEGRVAVLEEPAAGKPPQDQRQLLAMPAWMWPPHELMNEPLLHRSCMPACSGIMSAKALAKHYAALLPRGIDGVRLLSPERVKLASAPLELEGSTLPVGLGYQLGLCGPAEERRLTVFGHEGYGGSIGFADPDRQLAVGITHNLFSSGKAAPAIIEAITRSIMSRSG